MKIKDEKFLNHSFFDVNDLIQVRYEMVRYCKSEEKSISDIANLFGTSRLTVYRLIDLFEKQGLGGLIPQKRGPKDASKVSSEIIEFSFMLIEEDRKITKKEILKRIESKFGIVAHRRTLERALKKNDTQKMKIKKS